MMDLPLARPLPIVTFGWGRSEAA
eukprot:SAG31_NODE_10411_length_1141_cov_1.381958_1_plen_23_part_10